MAILRNDGIQVALEIRTALVELDVEPEVLVGARCAGIWPGRLLHHQITAARDEAGGNRLRDRYHCIIGRAIARVVILDDDADGILCRASGAYVQGYTGCRRANGR